MRPTGRQMRPAGRLVTSALGAGLLLVVLLAVVAAILLSRPRGPQLAPEAERVRSAQSALPFQVLIPAFLPDRFGRADVILRSGLEGPAGETMVELVYTDRSGGQLVLHEWLPQRDAGGNLVASAFEAGTSGACRCGCPMCGSGADRSGGGPTVNPFQVDRDRLRVLAGITSPEVVTYPELQTILSTLAPAAGLTVYSTMEQVPLTDTVPPAVPVDVGSDGVQELVLVVTPNGYSPPHFSVKAGVPVRIRFRQLGYVGCGNELQVEWAAGGTRTAVLESADDVEVIEFTPDQAGDFSFHCPHLIYRGVMSVSQS